ncbi:MAG: hypothetical protein K6G66_10940, partial [Oscillospiraceae bacterium]|nr:hypothetical protein [Oscillospiraceae bacterium]
LIYAKTRNWGPGGLEAPIFFSAQNETGYLARNETAASAGVEPAETMKTLKTAWKHRRFCGFGAFFVLLNRDDAAAKRRAKPVWLPRA